MRDGHAYCVDYSYRSANGHNCKVFLYSCIILSSLSSCSTLIRQYTQKMWILLSDWILLLCTISIFHFETRLHSEVHTQWGWIIATIKDSPYLVWWVRALLPLSGIDCYIWVEIKNPIETMKSKIYITTDFVFLLRISYSLQHYRKNGEPIFNCLWISKKSIAMIHWVIVT